MNPRPVLLLASLALFATALSAAPNFQPLANEIAAKFVASPKNGDGDLEKFLDDQEIPGQPLRAAVKDTLATARQIVAAGVPADSKYFARLLADSTGVAVPATAAPAVRSASPAPQAKAKEPDEATLVATGERQALAEGRLEEQRLSALLGQIDGTLATLTADDSNRAVTEKKRLEAYLDRKIVRHRIDVMKAEFEVTQAEAEITAAGDDATKKEASTQKARDARGRLSDARSNLSAYEAKRVRVDLGGLARLGFSVNAGYGYLRDARHYAPTVQVKYHFRSRLLGDSKPPPNFVGWLENNAKLTSVAGWVGYSMTGLEGEADPLTGHRERENPLLVGLSAGFGAGMDSCSAVNLDLGIGLFNKPGFKKQDWYAGVSVDASVFRQLIKAMGDVAGGK